MSAVGKVQIFRNQGGKDIIKTTPQSQLIRQKKMGIGRRYKKEKPKNMGGIKKQRPRPTAPRGGSKGSGDERGLRTPKKERLKNWGKG